MIVRLPEKCLKQTPEVTYHSPAYHENRVQTENTAWVNEPDSSATEAVKRRLRYTCLVDCATFAELRALPEYTALSFYKRMVPAHRAAGTLDGITHLMHLMAASMTRAVNDQDGASQVELEEPSLPPLSVIPTVLTRYKDIVNAHLSVKEGFEQMAGQKRKGEEVKSEKDS